MSRLQVSEQRGEENLVGPPGAGCDFDMFLYEFMSHGFIERNIGSEEFWKSREDVHVLQVIKSLKKLEEHCERVAGKLEIMLRIKKNLGDSQYIPMPGDVLFVPSVSKDETIQGIAIEGGTATVLDVDGSGRIYFYSFPGIPFPIAHVMQNQMRWMNTYGFELAHPVDEEDLAPELSESDNRDGEIQEVTDPEEIVEIVESLNEDDDDGDGMTDGEPGSGE